MHKEKGLKNHKCYVLPNFTGIIPFAVKHNSPFYSQSLKQNNFAHHDSEWKVEVRSSHSFPNPLSISIYLKFAWYLFITSVFQGKNLSLCVQRWASLYIFFNLVKSLIFSLKELSDTLFRIKQPHSVFAKLHKKFKYLVNDVLFVTQHIAREILENAHKCLVHLKCWREHEFKSPSFSSCSMTSFGKVNRMDFEVILLHILRTKWPRHNLQHLIMLLDLMFAITQGLVDAKCFVTFN